MILDESQEEELKLVLKELGEERAGLYAGYEYKSTEWESIKQKILKGVSVEVEPSMLNAEKAILLSDRKLPDTLVRKMPIRHLNWTVAAAIVAGITIGTYFLVQPKTNSKSKEATIT